MAPLIAAFSSTIKKMALLTDELHAAGLPHVGGGEVGVRPGSVPVTVHRFRVVGDHHAKVLTDPAF
jgi:hypothetical protein